MGTSVVALRLSRALGSRPAASLAISATATVLLAVIALVAGNFSIAADNAGWYSRGTTLADRHVQLLRLFDWDWNDSEYSGCGPSISADCWAQEPRRLSEEKCKKTRSSDLTVIYRAKQSDADLLSPNLLRQVCELESEAIRVLRAGACQPPSSGCSAVRGGECLAPVSVVSLLRDSLGWELACADLAADPATVGLAEALGLVGYDYTADSPSTRTLAAVFPLVRDSALDFLLEVHHAGTLRLASADVDTAYGMWRRDDFRDAVRDEVLFSDMALVYGSLVVSLVCVLAYTRSLFLSVVGLLQVCFSFPLAFFCYSIVCRLDFFPFLNFLGLFVIMGIGVDDLFVVVDKWSQAARSLPPGSDVPTIAAVAGPDAALTMLLTSLTTAAAFFATAVVPVAPVRVFAIFMGFMVLADYLLCLTVTFSAVCLQHRWLQRAPSSRRARCLLSLLDFSRCSSRPPQEAAAPRARVLERLMSGPMHTAVHRGRFVLLALFFAALGLCVWQVANISPPSSTAVQLLPESHVVERYETWKQDFAEEASSEMFVVWGLTPGDTGDHNNPELVTDLLADLDWDPSSREAQRWLLDFCSATASDPAAPRATDIGCPLRDMDDWLVDSAAAGQPRCGGASRLPVPPDAFHPCVEEYLSSEDRYSWYMGMRTYRGRLVALVASYKVVINFDSSYEQVRDTVDEWEGWMDTQNKGAPDGVRGGFFTSARVHWWDTNRSMLLGAYYSIGAALAVVFVVFLLATLNPLTTVYATVSVGTVLLLVIGTVLGVGWELGFLEGICFAILIGLSCDFVLHMAHAYTSADQPTRELKSRDALARMGPPVFAAAMTTLSTGLVMFGCTFVFFFQFGTILVLTMLYSILTSLFFFLPLTNAAGPTGRCCSLAPLCTKGRASGGADKEASTQQACAAEPETGQIRQSL